MRRFETAPWPISLKVVSGLATIVLAGATYVLIRDIPQGTQAPFAESFGLALTAIPLLTAVIASLFAVRSYEIEPRELLIHRLLRRLSSLFPGLETKVGEAPALKKQ
jgi:hypothetical protein